MIKRFMESWSWEPNAKFRNTQMIRQFCGSIVAHDVSLCAQTGKHLLRTQNVSEQNQKHFCVPDTKFVSATNVACTGKRGNICVGNNVSSFASTLIFIEKRNSPVFLSLFPQINISSTRIWKLYYRLFCLTSWVILKQLDPSPSRAIFPDFSSYILMSFSHTF